MLELVQDLVEGKVLDADHEVAAHLAELGWQGAPRRAAAMASKSARVGATALFQSMASAISSPRRQLRCRAREICASARLEQSQAYRGLRAMTIASWRRKASAAAPGVVRVQERLQRPPCRRTSMASRRATSGRAAHAAHVVVEIHLLARALGRDGDGGPRSP